jgi:hypothetical protein
MEMRITTERREEVYGEGKMEMQSALKVNEVDV